ATPAPAAAPPKPATPAPAAAPPKPATPAPAAAPPKPATPAPAAAPPKPATPAPAAAPPKPAPPAPAAAPPKPATPAPAAAPPKPAPPAPAAAPPKPATPAPAAAPPKPATPAAKTLSPTDPLPPLVVGQPAEKATEANKKKAVDLFKAGNDAFNAGKYLEALAKFRESYGLITSPNSRMMYARTLGKLDRLLDAHREGNEALAEASAAAAKNPKYEATVKGTKDDLAVVAKRIAFVTFAPPPGISEGELTVNGKPLDKAEWSKSLPMLPAKLEVAFVRGDERSQVVLDALAGATLEAKLPPFPKKVVETPLPPPEPVVVAEPDSSVDDTIPANDRGAAIVGLKAGALASLNGLKPHVTGAVQVGYVLPFLQRSLGVIVDVGYAQPLTSKTEFDPRVAGGSYGWQLVQQQLTIQPSVYYRATMLPKVGPGKFVPYVGAGPRIFLTRSKTDSEDKLPVLLQQNEQSMEIGLGAHLGTEYLLGPGAIVAEGLFGWAAVDQRTTGDAALTGISGWAGYRFML
ncbi:MAG: CDC27 family protein, partial [Deltaproteobacteria bacterium]|nr:CDC27 family protein [Deltaproteobacteria bacterium]